MAQAAVFRSVSLHVSASIETGHAGCGARVWITLPSGGSPYAISLPVYPQRWPIERWRAVSHASSSTSYPGSPVDRPGTRLPTSTSAASGQRTPTVTSLVHVNHLPFRNGLSTARVHLWINRSGISTRRSSECLGISCAVPGSRAGRPPNPRSSAQKNALVSEGVFQSRHDLVLQCYCTKPIFFI